MGGQQEGVSATMLDKARKAWLDMAPRCQLVRLRDLLGLSANQTASERVSHCCNNVITINYGHYSRLCHLGVALRWWHFWVMVNKPGYRRFLATATRHHVTLLSRNQASPTTWPIDRCYCPHTTAALSSPSKASQGYSPNQRNQNHLPVVAGYLATK